MKHQSREGEGSRRNEQERRRRNDKVQKSRRLESSEQWNKVECRDMKKRGGCQWGSACRYLPPKGVGREEQVKMFDCKHWMEGYWMFKDDRCKNIHTVKKRAPKRWPTSRIFSRPWPW